MAIEGEGREQVNLGRLLSAGDDEYEPAE